MKGVTGWQGRRNGENEMPNVTKHTSVPGILRPFREFLSANRVSASSQIVYYGVPGTCTPFIELCAFAARGLGAAQVFVPLLEEGKARLLKQVPDVGMQAGDPIVVKNPAIIVIMGGLAMPDVPVEAGMVGSIITRHPGARVVGICFMSMFEKAGWLKEISFDLHIDATIDPVTVTVADT